MHEANKMMILGSTAFPCWVTTRIKKILILSQTMKKEDAAMFTNTDEGE